MTKEIYFLLAIRGLGKQEIRESGDYANPKDSPGKASSEGVIGTFGRESGNTACFHALA